MKWSGVEAPREMRRAMRVRSKGSIQLRRGARTIRGRVVDLAIGGASLHVVGARKLQDLIGRRVTISLGLDASTMVFSLVGSVVRASSKTGLVAVEWHDVTSAFEACIRDELRAASAYDTAPHVIIVDNASDRRHAIASAFRGGGCEVSEVSTPCEAIAQIDHDRFEPGVIAIADTVPESVAEDLRELLRREHPLAHMVAIGTSPARCHPGSSWLSGDPKGDVAIRVGRVITAHEGRSRPRRELGRK